MSLVLEATAVSNRDAPRAKIGSELRNMVVKERSEWMVRERWWMRGVKEAMEDLLISYKVKSWLIWHYHCHGKPISKLRLTPAVERRLPDGMGVAPTSYMRIPVR